MQCDQKPMKRRSQPDSQQSLRRSVILLTLQGKITRSTSVFCWRLRRHPDMEAVRALVELKFRIAA